MTRSIFTDKYRRLLTLLKKARRAAGFSQKQLASKLERPQSYVSKFERGERRLDFIEFLEIAKILCIDVMAFIRQLNKSKHEEGGENGRAEE